MSVVPETICSNWADYSWLKASMEIFPLAKTARLCYTIKIIVRPPLIFESLSPNMRDNGLTKHIETNTMKPASIKQNRKKQMWILTMVFLPTPSCGLDMMLCESCSSSFYRRVAVCDSDVEIEFMMRAAYDNNRKVECPSYTFLVLWRYYQQRNLCLGRLLWDPQKGNSFLHIQTLNLQPQVIQQG